MIWMIRIEEYLLCQVAAREFDCPVELREWKAVAYEGARIKGLRLEKLENSILLGESS